MYSTAQSSILCSLFGIEPDDLVRYTKNVYGWGSVLWEIVGAKSPTVQLDHYVKIKMYKREWLIRELGKGSKLYKEIHALPTPEVSDR